MSNTQRVLVLVFLTLCVSSCRYGVLDKNSGELSIMTFNVENLFDTLHDPSKNDYTYLPIAQKQNSTHRERCKKIKVNKWREECLHWDWNEQVLDYKLKHIAEVIQQYNNGMGPDIVVFQEVENRAVLRRLIDEYLKGSGYLDPVLLEGRDLRGIDVAFISRFELASPPQLHPIDFRQIDDTRKADTRGILQADFKLPTEEVISAFAVHFPAPFHPFELRIDSYRTLNRLLQALPSDRLAVAAGDFNTPSTEDKEQGILKEYVTPSWLIAHHQSCRTCLGTYYYAPKDEWSFLDMILVSREGSKRWRLASTQLMNGHPEQRDPNGFPNGFEIDGPSGISDHWPLLVELKQ